MSDLQREGSGTVRGPAGPIAWRSLGSGPPLVLINGYAATAADWDPGFTGALAESSTVYLPDNRGMAGSACPVEGMTVEAMAADVLALLDELGIAETDLAGWSMGGFVAQSLAATSPSQVRRLVLLGTSAGGADAPRSTGDVWRSLTDHSGTPEEQARRLLGVLFPPPVADRVYSEFGSIVAAARAELDPTVLSAQEAAMVDWMRGPAHGRTAAIEAPALIAAGAEDVVMPPGNAELLAAGLEDSWLARFPGCGHAFMAQEPERVVALIGAFLGR